MESSAKANRHSRPVTVSIAGVDPSGGAGVLADVKAMSACGAYACGVVTAITSQNTCGVTGVWPVNLEAVKAQIDTLWDDVAIDAVKIGMLGTPDLVRLVADRIRHYRPRFVVLDPVMVAKSGDPLLAEEAISVLREELLPLATMVTPNLPEALALLGEDTQTTVHVNDMKSMAERLRAMMNPEGILYLKGGHLDADELCDLIVTREKIVGLACDRIQTPHTHGTGCTLSSALAAYLPQFDDPIDAARAAKAYIHGAIKAAPALQVGHGHGPTDHFWRLYSQ